MPDNKNPYGGNFEKFYRKKKRPSASGSASPQRRKKKKRASPQSPAQSVASPSPEKVNYRLNKYLAHAGIASRREADELIKQGLVTVNGKVITQMGYSVQPGDIVRFKGSIISPERKVYILLNKPKDYITTTCDERNRKTVLDLIKGATPYRVYPVGRLDRNTTGLLMLTNDGDLAQKLSHPRHEVKKVYAARLDKALHPEDRLQMMKGIQLEEGLAKADAVEYTDPNDASRIGLEIHIGWNRVIRRMFEQLGYEVLQLDRVSYAGLTKKNLPRGKWRFLTRKEIIMLKHFS